MKPAEYEKYRQDFIDNLNSLYNNPGWEQLEVKKFWQPLKSFSLENVVISNPTNKEYKAIYKKLWEEAKERALKLAKLLKSWNQELSNRWTKVAKDPLNPNNQPDLRTPITNEDVTKRLIKEKTIKGVTKNWWTDAVAKMLRKWIKIVF